MAAQEISGTRERILEAATRQFAHHGFHKVTMSDIARAVGMGKTSLYYYFAAKDDLFREIVVREQQVFAESIDRILRSGIPAAEKITAYVEERFTYMNRLLNLNILNIQPDDTMKPILISVFEDFSKQELKLLHRIIKEGKESGDFVVSSPDKVAEAFLHTLQGLRLRYLRRFRGSLMELKDYRQLKPEMTLMTQILIRAITSGNTGPPGF